MNYPKSHAPNEFWLDIGMNRGLHQKIGVPDTNFKEKVIMTTIGANQAQRSSLSKGFSSLAGWSLYILCMALLMVFHVQVGFSEEQKKNRSGPLREHVERLKKLRGRREMNNYITFMCDNKQRQYLLYVPEEFESENIPLVIVLHGTYGTGRKMKLGLGFDAYADQLGFAVAYPDAFTPPGATETARWNDGRATLESSRIGVDDVYFIREMVNHIAQRISLDIKRIYVTGASNGGIMTYRLALEASDLFAAAAPVIGNIAAPLYGKSFPSSEISLLAINGDDDPFIPINGGTVCPHVSDRFCEKGEVVSMEQSLAVFVRAAHCSPNPFIERLSPLVQDGTWVERRTFSGGIHQHEVVAYIIHGGGHTWPPHQGQIVQSGAATGNLDATQEIITFFLRHTKR